MAAFSSSSRPESNTWLLKTSPCKPFPLSVVAPADEQVQQFKATVGCDFLIDILKN